MPDKDLQGLFVRLKNTEKAKERIRIRHELFEVLIKDQISDLEESKS